MSQPGSNFGAIKDYGPSRTKQSFKDSCDVNKIIGKMWKAGTLSHLEQFQGQYADFSNFDFHEAQNRIAKGKSMFERLPAELKREFDQDPQKFFAFVNDPANKDRLDKLLPPLAEPGRQNVVNPRVDPAPAEGGAPLAAEQPVEETPAVETAGSGAETSPAPEGGQPAAS